MRAIKKPFLNSFSCRQPTQKPQRMLYEKHMSKERAQKIIAQSGIMSRRKAEEAIAEGRAALNGVVFTQMGQTVDSETDVLSVDIYLFF